MGVVAVKEALKAWLSEVPDLGTLTTAALDSDSIPREARGGRFWMLGAQSGRDGSAGFGDPNLVSVIRDYNCALEGWHGFADTREITQEWETLVDTLLQQLGAANIPPCRVGIRGIYGFTDLAWDGLEVRIIREGSSLYRAHHVRITFTVRVRETYLK